MPQFIAADTGGTFTDVTIYDTTTGRLSFGKTLTTYGHLVDGVIGGIREAGGSIAQSEWLRHGTTHVINAFLQRSGARTALVTTKGFRDVLEIARGNRPAPFDRTRRREPPLVPRALRFEVRERIGSAGDVVTPLDEAELSELAARLAAADVEAVAVSFINAYLNPAHEDRAVGLLRDKLSGVYITSSTALSREWFEYERTSTGTANAYVGPSIARYTAGFADRLAKEGFSGRFTMMGSNGGVMPVEAAIERPIALVESGPIGGVIAAAEYARALSLSRVVAFDMGGTTAKCALVENGGFEVQSTYWVGGNETGFPIRSPVLDIVEVGAGGGSIAWVDGQKRLRVGPRSAGSEPGPVAFGRGGSEPTVTDANLYLGRISSGSFLGGQLSLDRDAAARAIQGKIAEPLGYGADAEAVARVAHGILEISTTLMAGAIKEITVARGHDVRGFALLVFGGGGPIFGAELARQLGISKVVVPAMPGNFSALGMLFARARFDLARSFIADLTPHGMKAFQSVVEELEEASRLAAAREFGSVAYSVTWQAEMRYRGQRHSIAVPCAANTSAAQLLTAFEATYAKRFGRTLGEVFAPEIVGLRAIAEAEGPRPTLDALVQRGGTREHPSPIGKRRLHIRDTGWIEVPAWRRDSLPAGFTLSGPCIVEEYSSTLLLGPGDAAVVGRLGEIVVTVGRADGGRR